MLASLFFIQPHITTDSKRVLHNLRPCAKNGDFCPQLGSKAQFIQ